MEVGGRSGGSGLGIIAGDREDVLDADAVHVFEGGAQVEAIAADAGQVNIGREAAGTGGGADADGILAEGSAGETGDASSDYGGDTGQVRGDFEQAGFAHGGAGYQF